VRPNISLKTIDALIAVAFISNITSMVYIVYILPII
jgi:hypothetical protein